MQVTNMIESLTEEQALAIENAKRASEFYDKCKNLTPEQSIAVGTDAIDWMIKCTQDVAAKF